MQATPPREAPKAPKPHSYYRERALMRFVCESKSKRSSLLNRLRQTHHEHRSEVIKSWLQHPPNLMPSSPFAPSDFDWAQFVDSPEYQDLVLQIESTIQEEAAAEEDVPVHDVEEDCGQFDEWSASISEEANDPDAILCPLCERAFLRWDGYVSLLLCRCGAAIGLNSRLWGRRLSPAEFKALLCDVHQRHASYCAALGCAAATGALGLRCIAAEHGMLAHCDRCGFHEPVL